MNLKMGSRIIAATGIAALLFALAACNQGHNPPKGTQGQSTQPSKDELGLKDKVSNSLTAAVTTLNAKKIMLDPANKQFTIQAASTETALSAKDIFKGSDYDDITQAFTVTPASGSVTVASDKSKLTIGYASNTEGDKYTVTLTFTHNTTKKVSTFNFTVINKKQQPPKDELNLKAKVAASLAAAVTELEKKDIKFDAADNKFVIGPDSTATELSAKEIFKGTNYNGMTQEFTVTPASGSVTVASDKSKLAIKVASKTEGDSYAVKLTFTKDKTVSEFKFTVINKKQNALRDELNLKEHVKKAFTTGETAAKLNKEGFLFDAVEKKFVIKPGSDPVEVFFKDYLSKNNDPYKNTKRELTVTPSGGSIRGETSSFDDYDEGKLNLEYPKDKKNGDTFTVMYTFKKDNKVSEFKFTFVNTKKKVYDKTQIKGQIERLVQKINGNDGGIWTHTKKHVYEKNGILLPETGDEHDIKDVKLTWGLKQGRENKAKIEKNKNGKTVVSIKDSEVGHKVVLTVTVALPGENMIFDELPDPTNTNALLAFSLSIES